MRLRPPKNLVGMFDVLGVREFRLSNDQVYEPVLLWARLNERAHILETNRVITSQFACARHFLTAYHKLQK